MPPRPTIREASFEDYPGISALQIRYGLEPKEYGEWKHLWVDNPVYQQARPWPIGWVLETGNKEIAGYIGNVPLSYEFRGQQLLATTSHALVVDSLYRPYSLPLLSHFFNQKNVDLFVDTTVNTHASRSHELFRARRVPAGAWDASSFWITNYKGFLASVLTRKNLALLKPVIYPLSIGLQVEEVLSRRAIRPGEDGIEIRTCNTFDERFERFWHQLRCSLSNLLLATRSREVLEWHFQNEIAKNRAWVVTVDDRSEIVAYAIFFRQDNVELGLKRVRLADFQALNGNTKLLASILPWALEQCCRQRIHMLEVIGLQGEKQRIIAKLKPRQRRLSSWRYFYKTNNKALAESIQNPRVWDPCCFDGDASL
jgi:hypothetical protein